MGRKEWEAKLWKSVLIAAALTSTLIELSQYIFALGECEFDDVISNTLGAMIGWGVLWKIKPWVGLEKKK